ncbi:2601_t:CDS:2 [Gigaspora margarita]|uniref:2601_t:CDS:1 n=1 Tax=Gigaspora margarita TaxID=4874 RepID=A0ABN7VEP2_GIGMA|nr:2601_t:CDS:2 [Gigaspora margarita]
MSGGYGHCEILGSTWDRCCKGPLGNLYMLEEISERYWKASPKSFANTRIFFVHTHNNKIELWQMHNCARGILQWEQGMINTANIIKQLQDEDNDGVSKLSGGLPPHPGKPDKELYKKGINNIEVKSDISSSPIRKN